MDANRADANTGALVGLRVAIGVLFLIFAQYKVFGSQFTLGGGFQFWIDSFLKAGAYPFMVPVLKGFVLGHAGAIAFLAAYGELAIGLALVFGVLVRAASGGGPCLHADAAVRVELSGPRCPVVAILRSVTGASGAGDVLRDFCPGG